MKRFLLVAALLYNCATQAQPRTYTTAQVHSHNDYEQAIPFKAAWLAQFGSIEADVFLKDGRLMVAHEASHIDPRRSLEALYLQPLVQCVQQNNGTPYKDPKRPLQMLIDLKTAADPTLDSLVALLKRYPVLSNNPLITWVISGNRPAPADFVNYPAFILFDGRPDEVYTPQALTKVGLISEDFTQYTTWNGKGVITAVDLAKIKPVVEKVHALHKPVRFWATPDGVNAWYQLMKLDIDYLNTDHIAAMESFMEHLPAYSYTTDSTYQLYTPTYASDGSKKKAKNIILFIGDGTGLAQLYSGYTANKGALNIFNMRHIGLSKTSSHDSYVTDSAPGGTSISTGQKTDNRFVGVDHTGASLREIPDYIAPKKKWAGVITSGDLTDATPAAFYAHRVDRDSSAAILKDLSTAYLQFLMGSGSSRIKGAIARELTAHGYHLATDIETLPSNTTDKWVVADDRAGKRARTGRGDWLPRAVDKGIAILSKHKPGFFLMVEGAQIDYGGHANNLGYVATEVMDLDQAVARALEFADQDGETLVIVTADHETGGLSLLDGDFTKGYVSGHFSSNDHSGIPVPVFAYGPGAELFGGVYENTAIFHKILTAMGVE